MAEAALVLDVRGSAPVLAVLRLRLHVVLLKPAHNKVAEEPGEQQNSEHLYGDFPHPSVSCWHRWENRNQQKSAGVLPARLVLQLVVANYGSFRLAEVSVRRLTVNWTVRCLRTVTRTFRSERNRGRRLKKFGFRRFRFTVKLAKQKYALLPAVVFKIKRSAHIGGKSKHVKRTHHLPKHKTLHVRSTTKLYMWDGKYIYSRTVLLLSPAGLR